jgi:hypothetical protein
MARRPDDLTAAARRRQPEFRGHHTQLLPASPHFSPI